MPRIKALVGAGAIVLLVWAVYWPVLSYQFVFDDHQYIIENRPIYDGLTARGVAWAFTTFTAGNWHPLTWISHMLDVTSFGMRPGGPHMMNVAWHSANSVVLFLLLAALTGAFGRSLAVAALFAVHPLHVESVAWVSERKDLLSTFFGFLAIAAYVVYSRRRSVPRLLAVVACYALSLLSKQMLVTLPFLLLLLDFYPLGSTGDTHRGKLAGWPARLAEKLPLFALAATASAVALIAQSRGGGLGSTEIYALPYRLQNAVLSYARYVGLTLWPEGLACFYPHPLGAIAPGRFLLAGAALAVVTGFAVALRRCAPYLPMGWLWFLGALVPVIGFVQVGGQAMADRYTYVPLVGLFIALIWSGDGLARHLPAAVPARALTVAGAAAAVLACGFLARAQMAYWRDDVALFERAIRVTAGNFKTHKNLAAAYYDRGRRDLAILHYYEALKLDSGDAQSHFHLAVALMQSGRKPEADFHFKKYSEIIRQRR